MGSLSSAIVILVAAFNLLGFSQQASRPEEVVAVTLTEWKIDMPSSLPAGRYTFKVTNKGEHSHTLKIKSEGFEKKLAHDVKPGQSGELKVDLKPGVYEVTCPIGFGPISHEAKGMKLRLTVTPLH